MELTLIEQMFSVHIPFLPAVFFSAKNQQQYDRKPVLWVFYCLLHFHIGSSQRNWSQSSCCQIFTMCQSHSVVAVGLPLKELGCVTNKSFLYVSQWFYFFSHSHRVHFTSANKSKVQNQNRIMKTQHVGSIMEQRTYSICNDSSGVIFKYKK